MPPRRAEGRENRTGAKLFSGNPKLPASAAVSSDMSDLEPNDPLWKLLGNASPVEPSPFFARNVVREARLLGDAPKGWLERVRRLLEAHRTLWVTSAGALAAVALAAPALVDAVRNDSIPLSLNEESVEAFDPASEMAAVEYLGQLMAVADPGQLDDEALADLFF